MKKISILLAIVLLLSVFAQTVLADETTSATLSEETTTTLGEETTTTLTEETTTLPLETTVSTTMATTLGKQQTVTPKLLIINRNGNITARVLGANREPVAGIRVTLQLGSTKMNALTDQNGYALFAMPFPKDNSYIYCSTQQTKIGNTTYLAAEASAGKKVKTTVKKTTKKTTAVIAQQTEVPYQTYYTTGETIATEQTTTTAPTTAVKRSEMGGVVDIIIIALWVFGLACVGVGIFLLFRFVINPKQSEQEADEEEQALEEQDEQTEEALEYEQEQSFWDADEPAPLPKPEKPHDIDIPL